ncbi:MAG: DUF3006 domain-containing protein [Gemmatimonadaceae bacterium]
MAESTHRWIIDTIEENAAAIEIDGKNVVTMPRWLLPDGARQGDVLRVSHDRPTRGQRSSLIIEIDRAATQKALADSAAQVQKGVKRPNDPGGNITL